MDIGHAPARRATTYFSRLLVLNDKPELSLEVLSNIQNQNYTTIRNLKVKYILFCKYILIQNFRYLH